MAFTYTYRSLPNGGRGNWNTGGEIVGFGSPGNIRPVRPTMAVMPASRPAAEAVEPSPVPAPPSMPVPRPQPQLPPQARQMGMAPSLLANLPVPAALLGMRPSRNWTPPSNPPIYTPGYPFLGDPTMAESEGKTDFLGGLPFRRMVR